jgi:hypothetical protein
MELIETILGVKTEEVGEFSIADSFNNDNLLAGYICRRQDHRYGALLITHINDEPCQQLIYATPKLHYPFDKNGDYHWPECKDVKYYEKLDGTNILAYHYEYKGKDFVTFKTRLTPVVKDMGFGMFESMLREYLDENTWVRESIELNPTMNLSFELFGSRNPITVKYDIPLALCLLFGVRRVDGAVRPPSEFNLPINAMTPYYAMGGDHGGDHTAEYNEFREKMSHENGNGQDDSFVIEGMVMYANTGEPSWRMFKCKPEEIEKIHWSASGAIPRIALSTTALNVFEDKENPSIEDFIELLKEEYPQSMIDRAMIKIAKSWEDAKQKIFITKNINEVWKLAKEKGLDVKEDKGATMRFMSQYFDKGMMRKVGSIVLKQAGLL